MASARRSPRLGLGCPRARRSGSGGTPADLAAAGRQMDGRPFSGLFLAAAIGVTREYPELLTIFNAKGNQQ
ncbi:lipase family protein [Kribbella sp. VKM Ac-2568]|uniref:lipase family protein n=1 Tax=Kribbella sp. VKM Ac-2568 TaxID=2512219 RepID=UPI00104FEFF4|nr:lipase family protein [Kribbella sp. VKM Ac-2568]TCM46035.1 secretory lipase [Kribbella sp. VKM Ac-2568]